MTALPLHPQPLELPDQFGERRNRSHEPVNGQHQVAAGGAVRGGGRGHGGRESCLSA